MAFGLFHGVISKLDFPKSGHYSIFSSCIFNQKPHRHLKLLTPNATLFFYIPVLLAHKNVLRRPLHAHLSMYHGFSPNLQFET